MMIHNFVIDGFDWGPCLLKMILKLDRTVDEQEIYQIDIKIHEYKKSYIDENGKEYYSDMDMNILEAYPCDESGCRVEKAECVALEIYCSPNDARVFCYNNGFANNNWCNPYRLDIAVTGLGINEEISEEICLGKGIMKGSENVDFKGLYKGAKTLGYISYEPDNINEKRPLVIWLHGAGEGGNDPYMLAYGNKVTALFGDEFQKNMNGAYILAPQCPTYWMEYDESGEWADNPGCSSVYREDLMNLIKEYVENNPMIDRDRIIVGGCSNGGFMTMDLIFGYPDYFAAAYPICEAYLAQGISDSMLERIKDIPIWFVYCKKDMVVPPEQYEIPVIDKLRKMDANIHVSVFDKVIDESGKYRDSDGNPFEYTSGHESWTYFFNNQCFDGNLNMWEWMKNQKNK